MVALLCLLRVLSEPAATLSSFVGDGNKKDCSSVHCLGKEATGPKSEAMPKATALGSRGGTWPHLEAWARLRSPILDPHY